MVEEEKAIYFTFGRMNPPTIGHEKLMASMASKAGRNPYRVYLSQSQDSKKNPLRYADKVKFARKMYPRYARNIMADKKIRNVFDIAQKLYNDGYKNIVMVVGSDRVQEFEILLKKYDGKKGKHGLYKFNKITVVSAGDRDPDAEGVSGMSASKMRAAASENDFTAFSQGLPKSVSNADAKSLYNAVRSGMGLKEQKEFKNHVQLESVSETREAYVAGDLYNVGDKVVIKETDVISKIKYLGTNYVVLETNGVQQRKWLDAVELLEDERPKKSKQDADIKDKPGTQPAVYYKGLKKGTKNRRLAHFKKHAKMDDDNPAAYKKAPGDANAKTKPSKHTLKYKRMYGEKVNVDAAKARIDREKQADKRKHDRMMDRARLRDVRSKNRETNPND